MGQNSDDALCRSVYAVMESNARYMKRQLEEMMAVGQPCIACKTGRGAEDHEPGCIIGPKARGE